MTAKMTVYNETSGKKLIHQSFFNDFNWDYEWQVGDIIWMCDYNGIDLTYMATQFIKFDGDKVFINPISNSIARKAENCGVGNIADIIWTK